jgi:molybdopterin converting factor subunit 1
MLLGKNFVKSPSNKTNEIPVTVLFFGAARDAVGQDQVALVLSGAPTAGNAMKDILEKYPELRRFGSSLLLAVNQEYARADRTVRADDELAVFPPVSGGAVNEAPEKAGHLDFFELTTEPIDVGTIARRVVLPECGATVTLDGYAREWTRGRRTSYLVYEAYAPMAVRELERLGHEAHKQFEIAHIGIVHRTGRLEIGETSVVIAVSAPHRAAAFAACEWAIRELKRTVPIWKKEVFKDGEMWVEGEGASKESSK